MKRLKVLAVVSFCLFLLAFYGNRWTTPIASGVTGGPALAAPTGVSASNADYVNKVGINWDTIRGATDYRIFRNTLNDSGTATDLGTTVANFFFDSTAVTSQNYFYWIRAENGGSLSPLSSSAQGVRGLDGGGGGGAFSPLEPPVEPAGNPVTATKAYLGKALFWDEQLSSTRTVSCGTCHQASAGGADPRSLASDPATFNPGPDQVFGNADDIIGSKGVPSNNLDGTYNLTDFFGLDEQVTGRLAPSYINAQYATDGLFWDGRAPNEFRDPITNVVVLSFNASLESQSTGPPVSDAEMAHAGRNWTQVAAQIETARPLALATNIPTALETWIDGRTYPELFQEAFGTIAVTPARIAMAIATHERTLFSDRTPFDRAVAGIQPLQPIEAQGRQLFVSNDCNFCHTDALLSDQLFHNIGVRPQSDDAGRFGVTNIEFDRASFRTPSLRNGELRPAFMHNGRFANLGEVVDFYARGGDFDAPNINHTVITPRIFTPMERDALIAFMGRPLTDPRVANELPPFDRPTLYTETARVPVISGSGRVGTGGEEPNVTAVEPPLAGNPSFTIGVSNVIPSSQAVLVIDSSDPGVGTSIPPTAAFAHETIQTTDNGSGAGYGSVSLSIPATASVVGETFFGRWYITDGAAVNGFAVSPLFEFTVFGDAVAPGSTRFDLDGDSRTDIGVWRPGPGEWWYLRSIDSVANAFQFGQTSDTPVPADFTGDGVTDVAFWRNGQWFVLRSEDSSFFAFPFGTTGDIPAPGDFDGDGKADPAVFRSSNATWYYIRSSDGTSPAIQFGANGDIPIVEDYDGDGTDDLAVYRPGVSEWFLNRSTDGFIGFSFGAPGDTTPVPADFTGDSKADIAFFKPSTSEWFVLRSEDRSFFAFPFGTSGDIPAPGDYDGDGTADAAVFRPSNNIWYLNQSTSGSRAVQFGIAGDVPIPSAYIP